ncbi:MAG: Asp-tRNA(Asn)/Glu-tRNA(Gln) amidotransferase subunit GatA [bacterium]|nr:Asp-tRNA(Asn)/Glu-tRNA(Gln) amidotransferase subunit GatA [bacterium]
MNIYDMTLHQLWKMLREGETTVQEIYGSFAGRIEEVEGRVGAFVNLTPDLAERQVLKAADRWSEGRGITPLTGLPVAVKDNMSLVGVPVTCSSRMLENYIPPYNATVVERLAEDGAIFPGKTNMDEFAMGSSTENSAFKVTRNPWHLDYVPGGSSGGSAAAVAAGEVPAALGSDTGGSIRQPSSFCGVVGMKPTYGRVSRYGLVAFASSLDQIGPITRDVRDCAIMMNALSGHDACDSTSADIPVPDHTAGLGRDVRGLRIGLPKELFGEGIDAGVRQAVRAAVDLLVGMGAECMELSLPHLEYSLPVYYIIATAEASSNLARYDGVQYGYRADDVKDIIDMYSRTRSEGFGTEVKRRIILGTYALSSGYYDAFYLKAQKVRTLIKSDFDKAFTQVDLLITPVSPTTAFKVGEEVGDPVQMYLSDICTIPINLAGVPAISMPCGFDNGLPVGMQIIGKPFDETTMLRAAYAYEQSTDWHKRRAALAE